MDTAEKTTISLKLRQMQLMIMEQMEISKALIYNGTEYCETVSRLGGESVE